MPGCATTRSSRRWGSREPSDEPDPVPRVLRDERGAVPGDGGSGPHLPGALVRQRPRGARAGDHRAAGPALSRGRGGHRQDPAAPHAARGPPAGRPAGHAAAAGHRVRGPGRVPRAAARPAGRDGVERRAGRSADGARGRGRGGPRRAPARRGSAGAAVEHARWPARADPAAHRLGRERHAGTSGGAAAAPGRAQGGGAPHPRRGHRTPRAARPERRRRLRPRPACARGRAAEALHARRRGEDRPADRKPGRVRSPRST